MCKLKKIDCIAITDHNSCLQLDVIEELKDSYEMLIVPGAEIEVKEKYHVVCLFKTFDIARKFQKALNVYLDKKMHDEEIYGEQNLFDAFDDIVSNYQVSLMGSSNISVLDLRKIVKGLDGVMILAHIEKYGDDVFDKLDMNRISNLLQMVTSKDFGQIFITDSNKVRMSGIPTIVVINKVDLSNPEKLTALVEKWQALLPEAVIAPCSAKENFNVGGLFDLILSMLPEGEPYYPKDTLTDKTLRFFASEIIREKIFLNYDKEVPYSVEIAIEEYREEPKIDRISATIYVTRDSQKGIIIGHKGEKLKRVGMQAREDLERFLDKKVFLQLFVKVNDDWRNNDRQLRRFGYEQE